MTAFTKSKLGPKENSLDNWGTSKSPVSLPPSFNGTTDDHFISKNQAHIYADNWKHFKSAFDEMIKLSSQPLTVTNLVNIGKIFKQIEILKQYMLIDYETFALNSTDKFQARLEYLSKNAKTLQIAFGMKEIPDTLKNDPKYDEFFKGKNLMSCVILVGRDEHGNVMEAV